MVSQFKGNKELVEFLYWYLETVYRDNIYTTGFGADRALADGKAKQAEDLYLLIRSIAND